MFRFHQVDTFAMQEPDTCGKCGEEDLFEYYFNLDDGSEVLCPACYHKEEEQVCSECGEPENEHEDPCPTMGDGGYVPAPFVRRADLQ